MLCVKGTLQLHKGQTVDGDIPEPESPSVVEEGSWEGIGVERMRDDSPLPATEVRLLSKDSGMHGPSRRLSTPHCLCEPMQGPMQGARESTGCGGRTGCLCHAGPVLQRRG